MSVRYLLLTPDGRLRITGRDDSDTDLPQGVILVSSNDVTSVHVPVQKRSIIQKEKLYCVVTAMITPKNSNRCGFILLTAGLIAVSIVMFNYLWINSTKLEKKNYYIQSWLITTSNPMKKHKNIYIYFLYWIRYKSCSKNQITISYWKNECRIVYEEIEYKQINNKKKCLGVNENRVLVCPVGKSKWRKQKLNSFWLWLETRHEFFVTTTFSSRYLHTR